MRIALFSDIHGNITGLKAVLAHLDELGGADLLISAGDMVAGGEEIFDLLLEREARMVRGNHEEIALDYEAYIQRIPEQFREWSLRDADWLRAHISQAYWELMASLPLTVSLEFAPGKQLFACHADPADPWALMCAPNAAKEDLYAAFGEVEADVIAYGHFHEHHLLWLDSKLLLNVASVGFRKDGLSAYTLIESFDSRWVVQQYQVPYDTAEETRLLQVRGVPLLMTS
jgi:predicted phosphodiesterase